MAVYLAPVFNDAPYMAADSNPATGYLLYTYVAGSSTPATTYTTSSGLVQNSNPMILNSAGYPTTSGTQTQVWLTGGVTYKFALQTAAAAPVWSRDNLAGIGDVALTVDQWVSGPAPTFINATSFSIVGDQTSIFQIGRRVKTTNSGGTVYSTISNSVFGAVTTVTVTNDSGTIDSGLSAVSYGLMSSINHSVPGFAAAGDILSQSTAGTVSRIAVGTAGTVPMSRAAATSKIAYVAALNKAIYGLTYANNVADATNDLDIAVGAAMDATGGYWMTLGSALTKQSDVAWAVGSGNGGLDTGAVGNSDYYIWLIVRSDTGVVDVLYSLSSTAPTMPAQYDFKRLIGWFKRVGGTIVAFHAYETEAGGLEMNWDVPTLDVNLANTLTTSRRTDAVKVPLNFSTIATLNVVFSDAAGSFANICCPDQTDAAPSGTAAPLSNLSITVGGQTFNGLLFVRTSATGTIAARATTATIDLYAVVTVGFRWARRN